MSPVDRRTILVVDDSADLCRVVGRMLADSGFNVEVAQDGATGVELAIQHTPDLVLLDLVMPVVNGFDACTALRRHPLTRNIPIVVITGVPNSANVQAVMKLGADDVLAKPFTEETLTSMVKRAVTLGHSA
jgi:CheY-like chemotaxis protein